ncbi:MAG TPA: hypothetical protein PK324_18940, partial [Nocardioides sp.]|nr:hypothetical protein [Nocardioides sp.]
EMAWELAQGRPPEEVRAMARELARRQWLGGAKLLLGLAAVYLLSAVLLEDHEAGLGAAAFSVAIAAGLLLLAWLQGRRSGQVRT